MGIKGLQKTSLIDFPPYVSCTVFFGGCMFRCGYCYNVDLVFGKLPDIPEEEVLAFLKKRKNVLDGVCITGGEPTLYPNLKNFIAGIKDLGYKVKLDTNGINPEVVKDLLDADLLDYIAMDVKTTKEKYSLLCGAKVDLIKLQRTIEFIKNSDIDYEFRTTVIPDFYSEADAKEIGNWLKGSKRYALQQFVATRPTIDPVFRKKHRYSIPELKNIQESMKPFFEEVILREN
ncbi:MAG TPA: anaerobic ribonucleoside-triphosphate reductase activating protein [Candidatus Nanoarchaeia archaeon]|nr:anaerobic ribonucleoside-triphosphate reductase activating protein [Candidatus Nanoarchaeia archaeon]